MVIGYIFYRAWKNAKEYNKWLEPPKPIEEIEKTYTPYPTTQPQLHNTTFYTTPKHNMNYCNYYEDETEEVFN